jgi:uncharacterized protein YceH (UPF0502 family)
MSEKAKAKDFEKEIEDLKAEVAEIKELLKKARIHSL